MKIVQENRIVLEDVSPFKLVDSEKFYLQAQKTDTFKWNICETKVV